MMPIGVEVGVTASWIGTNSSSSGIIIRFPCEGGGTPTSDGVIFCFSNNCVDPLELSGITDTDDTIPLKNSPTKSSPLKRFIL
jgi:hypothetical protein